MSTVLLIIQARNGSTRLPQKVCRELFNAKSLLSCLLQRVKACRTITRTLVATTSGSIDDPIEALATAEDVHVFRGSEHDVLGRFTGAAKTFPSDYIVRICADSPIHDAEVIDFVVDAALKNPDVDYVSNMHPESFPYGLAVEVVPGDVLFRLDRIAHSAHHREHVTSYITDNRDLFRTHNVANDRDLSHLRLVVDYPEDFELAKQLYSLLASGQPLFSWRDAVEVLEKQPQLQGINAARNDRLTKQSSHHR